MSAPVLHLRAVGYHADRAVTGAVRLLRRPADGVGRER